MVIVAAATLDRPPPRLKRGDEMVFVRRSHPLNNTAVQVMRRGKPLLWPSSGGWFPGYPLGKGFDAGACLTHAQARAAEHGLRTGRSWFDQEGSLHVQLV